MYDQILARAVLKSHILPFQVSNFPLCSQVTDKYTKSPEKTDTEFFRVKYLKGRRKTSMEANM